jgi:hypothetical protein
VLLAGVSVVAAVAGQTHRHGVSVAWQASRSRPSAVPLVRVQLAPVLDGAADRHARTVARRSCRRRIGSGPHRNRRALLHLERPEWLNVVRHDPRHPFEGTARHLVDGVGGTIGRTAFELLRQGGRFCPFGMASGSFAPVSDDEAAARGVTLVRGEQLTARELRDMALMDRSRGGQSPSADRTDVPA